MVLRYSRPNGLSTKATAIKITIKLAVKPNETKTISPLVSSPLWIRFE